MENNSKIQSIHFIGLELCLRLIAVMEFRDVQLLSTATKSLRAFLFFINFAHNCIGNSWGLSADVVCRRPRLDLGLDRNSHEVRAQQESQSILSNIPQFVCLSIFDEYLAAHLERYVFVYCSKMPSFPVANTDVLTTKAHMKSWNSTWWRCRWDVRKASEYAEHIRLSGSTA
jgi:hypothetical protein